MFGTPEWPLKSLTRYLQTNSEVFRNIYKIWEPASGRNHIVNALNSWGWDCKGTDIQQGYDFLTMEPLNFLYQAIITNPPFSIKDLFLKRCYDLEVPFALLLPLTALSGKARIELYKEHGMQLLMLPKRIDFEYEDGGYKGKPWFSCAWFTNGFELPKDISYL